MDTVIGGVLHENGTWTDALGLLQVGVVDTWATASIVTLERSRHFKFTTPYFFHRYVALMKRQTSIYIDVDSMIAGVDVKVYGIALAIFIFLLCVSLCHERFNSQTTLQRANTLWHLLLSLFPSNGSTCPNQSGVTRKLLMATGGFGILILSSLYQAKLSEQLMIPRRPPVVTLKDIEKMITSGNAKLLTYNDAIMKYVASVSPVLRKFAQTTTQLNAYETKLDAINTRNGIAIEAESSVLLQLSAIPPAECANYVFVPFNEWTQIYYSLIMRKERADMLETMNVIVAERMSYVDDYIQSFQLKDECHKHIFPVYTPNPSYLPLPLVKISAPLVFLFSLLCLAFVILFVEIVFFKLNKVNSVKQTTQQCDKDVFEIHFYCNNCVEVIRYVDIDKYRQFLVLSDT
jgi:hypothetical protein